MAHDFSYIFTAIDKFSPAIRSINKNLSTFKEKLSKASIAAGKINKTFNKMGGQLSLKVGAPLTLIGQKVLRTAADFQGSMNMLHAVTKANAADMEKLRKKALFVGQTYIFTARQAANAEVVMAKAGSGTNEILGTMAANASAAAAAHVDLGVMAKANVGAMHSLGIEMKNLESFTDLISAASSRTLTNPQELSESMRYVGVRARMANIPLKETIAMMGQIVQSGVAAQQGARWFSQAIIKMQKPTPMGAKIIKALHLEFTDAAGNIKPLVPIIAKLEKLRESKTLHQSGFQVLFGTRGSSAIGAVLGEGAKSLQAMLDALDHAAGTTRRMAQAQMEGLPGAMKRLVAAFEHIQLVVERANDTFAVGFLDTITKTTLKISTLNPAIQRIIVEFGAFLTILGPVLLIIGKFLAVMAFLKIIAVSTALAIGGITLAVLGLGIAFAAAWKYSAKFRNLFHGMRQDIKSLAAGGIGHMLTGFFGPGGVLSRGVHPTTMATPVSLPSMSFAPGRLNEPQLVKSLLNINVKDNAGLVKNISGTSDSDHFEMNTGLNMSLAR